MARSSKVMTMVTEEERNRLNIALLFIETMLDAEHHPTVPISDLAWAAHSYIQSVTLPDCPPSAEAQQLFCELQTGAAMAEAKRHAT
jgi:hypothetical protein